jgi:hypothetical protein
MKNKIFSILLTITTLTSVSVFAKKPDPVIEVKGNPIHTISIVTPQTSDYDRQQIALLRTRIDQLHNKQTQEKNAIGCCAILCCPCITTCYCCDKALDTCCQKPCIAFYECCNKN